MPGFFIFLVVWVLSGSAWANGMHHHATYEATAPFPSLRLVLKKDAIDGYNLYLKTTQFRFTPENVNTANLPNQGHAHIYINGEKIRQYSSYFHLASKFLKAGRNKIEVTLNANDHSEFAIQGKKIAALVTVTR